MTSTYSQTVIDQTALLKELARSMGFSFAGVAHARRLDDEAQRLNTWLQAGMQGQMQYLERHFEKRIDPRELVPGAKSVVSLLYNYHTDKVQTDRDAPVLSKYAYGKDYHKVLKKRMKALMKVLEQHVGTVNGRCFVDSAPIMEREWARLAGLGWLGKNTLLINPRAGSYFFLAELIIDLELVPDEPIADHCGTCTRCIDACPTSAIAPEGYVLDARRCISYLTIELKDDIPNEYAGQMASRVFGCDICQDVCPWNRFSSRHEEPEFEPHDALMEMTAQQWHEMTQEVFDREFESSAVKRTGYHGLRRNLDFLKG